MHITGLEKLNKFAQRHSSSRRVLQRPLELDATFSDVTPSGSQLFERYEPIHIQRQIQLSGPAMPLTYPESAYQWLVAVLDGLIDFGQRHGHYGVIKLTEDEYQWLDDVLEELIYSVGENENHPLALLMEFIIRLIANYEDAHVPKLTELFPELVGEAPIKTAGKNKQSDEHTPKPSENELAAHAFFSISYLLGEGNLTKKALVAYDKAIALKPDFVEAYNNRGRVFQKLGKYDEAIADLGKAIGLDPDFSELYCNRGCTKGSSGESEAATTDFNKAIELDPKNVKAYYYRGVAKNQLGEYQDAIIDFDKAVELEFNSVNVYYYRALAKTLLSQYDAAISDYDKVIELKPDCIEAYYYRGNSKQELGQHDDALSDYIKAIRINPNYAEAYNSRGNLKGALGQYRDALADCTEAIRLKSDYAEAYANRGMAKVGLDRIGEAISDLQTALKLAEQQDDANLKVFVERLLQQLNNSIQ